MDGSVISELKGHFASITKQNPVTEKQDLIGNYSYNFHCKRTKRSKTTK